MESDEAHEEHEKKLFVGEADSTNVINVRKTR